MAEKHPEGHYGIFQRDHAHQMAEVFDRNTSAEMVEANANLIAAAPELLAACQHVIDTHGLHAQDGCKCDDCEYLRPISDAIRKALGQNDPGMARRPNDDGEPATSTDPES